MPIFNLLVTIFWVTFFVYWLVSAFGVKKNVRAERTWARSAGMRILLIVVIILVLLFAPLSGFFGYRFGPSVQAVGVVFCGAGIAFAIWARRHLGKNWSGTPSIKEDHELVTSGPYALVRHPIYTGMLAALFGSALVSGVVWFAIFIIFGANFIYRVPVEESFMMRLFPEAYPEYKKRTKALIPFIW